jgi:hypothetical protein
MSERRVIILGSTGSIGTQAIEAIEHLNALHARGEHPRSYRVVGLAAGKNAALLMEQSSRLHVRNLAINVDPEAVPRAMDGGVPREWIAAVAGGQRAFGRVSVVGGDGEREGCGATDGARAGCGACDPYRVGRAVSHVDAGADRLCDAG